MGVLGEFDGTTAARHRRLQVAQDGVDGPVFLHLDAAAPAAGHGPVMGHSHFLGDVEAARRYDSIALVDRASFETLATIQLPGGLPIEAETSEDGRYCLIANRNGNGVSVISYETRKEVRRIPSGEGPQEMTELSVPDALLTAGGFLK